MLSTLYVPAIFRLSVFITPTELGCSHAATTLPNCTPGSAYASVVTPTLNTPESKVFLASNGAKAKHVLNGGGYGVTSLLCTNVEAPRLYVTYVHPGLGTGVGVRVGVCASADPASAHTTPTNAKNRITTPLTVHPQSSRTGSQRYLSFHPRTRLGLAL